MYAMILFLILHTAENSSKEFQQQPKRTEKEQLAEKQKNKKRSQIDELISLNQVCKLVVHYTHIHGMLSAEI